MRKPSIAQAAARTARPVKMRELRDLGSWIFIRKHSFRIWAAGKNGESAVELFGEDDACKFMGIRHWTERELLQDAFAQGFREAIGIAADENKFASAPVALVRKP